jgi:hypothetical protein
MKRAGLFLIVALLVLQICVGTALFADERTQNLQSVIIESFDPETRASDWYVRGSKFSTQEFPKYTFVKAWPEALYGSNREGVDYEVLGINTKFDRQGYNYVEIFPVIEVDGELVSNPLPIPGNVKIIDLWVWGSEYDYYVELHLSDYTGVVHVLNLGDINYTGWQNLRVSVPSYIPQARAYIPYLKGLELVKLVLWTKPKEQVDNFFTYIDQIKCLTDMFVSRFDGDDLSNPERLNEVWSDAQVGGE